MNDVITYVQNWLLDDETIISTFDEVHWFYGGWEGASKIFEFEKPPSPYPNGSLLLTNMRLILVETYPLSPKDAIDDYPPIWYSVTGIASLAERPFGLFARSTWKGTPLPAPYVAKLTLYSGVVLILEARVEPMRESGRDLSRFLALALVQLSQNSRPGSTLAAHNEEERRKEEEKRRRD